MNRVLALGFRKVPSLLKTASRLQKPGLVYSAQRFYWPNDMLMHRTEGDYYQDPKQVAPIICKMVAMHDNCADPSKVTLDATFEELGMNDFDKAEILLMLELHYHIEISDDS